MNDKKNIDRLFQERFKDFEAEPNNQVWINIEAALNEKEKERKIIPFWMQFSGIAAAFILGLFALNTVLKTNPEIENSIVLDTKVLINSPEHKDSIPNKMEKETNPFDIKNSQQVVITNPKTVRNHEKEITPFTPSKAADDKKKNQNNTNLYFSKNHPPIKQTASGKGVINYNSLIADKNSAQNTNSFENIQNQTLEKKAFQEKNDSKIAVIESKKQPSIILESPNELEEILKKKEEEKQTVVLKNKWQIVPNVAAVYLNSNSGGSAIDPQFSENQKTADNSLSFGIGVNYAVSKKIALRTGINKLTLGYNTNNVVYSAGLSNNNLANISYTSNALIEIKNEAALNTLITFEKDLQKTNTGALNQKMGYYEVPLELSYAVLNKKFGINVIGGISTLFLNQNKISLVSSDTNVKLGEAQNLNQIHFSTNVGLGFKYQLVKSFQINFEPMVKYQLNTYSRDSGNYKPVFIGLYSGISYTF
ncbi:porin family protein [Flavobacterium gawalongense]|uniref:Porin family protein n=1 Tax=Flavobacterium gawalongense TaxID=2594432 RepID=A0A553BI12_9FLAO|nr:porin family protein [Flavobacterium gawalongense]TRX07369.1 porin family protein [Flavobacterium gawalongense]TRX07867.1 porin family protein [Flavobacterium gawalongense]TRX23332.1 porin family protein [Flavobacterium gawalongense]